MTDTAVPSSPTLSDADITAAAGLFGLEFTEPERALMVEELIAQRQAYAALRAVPLPNSVLPALLFQPDPGGAGQAASTPAPGAEPPAAPAVEGAAWTADDLAFSTVMDLSRLIAARRISSVELTQLYLERLRRYDPTLHCVITLTEDLALAQARRADAELAAGRWRGPLHGIPWGCKDLLAVRGYPTTWGAEPFKDQVFAEDATVVQRLEAAGAVLVAKLTMGELAWGDVWFGGVTRTPWNPAEGASGSSAGSGAATAAGLVGFAIGTETWGSIISPATRNGVTGLRPTFGRVSRHGAMALAWSMDKIGPMCRSAEDCALVLAAIQGPDGKDPAVSGRPFVPRGDLDLRDLRVGFLEATFAEEYAGRAQDAATLETLRSLGADLRPIKLPDLPVPSLSFLLHVEAAAAFDDLTRSNQDDQLVRQIADAWPNVLRAARFIPAVEYVQAQRVRTLLMQAMAALMNEVDLYLAPSFQGDNLLLTNLTGHPAIALPNGFTEDGLPTTITLTGRLFDEATLLAVARVYQEATDFHRRRPPLAG